VPARPLDARLGSAAPQLERGQAQLVRKDAAGELGAPPVHAHVLHLLAFEAALEDRLAQRALPAAVELAAPGQAGPLRLRRSQRAPQPDQQRVRHRDVARLSVDAQIGGEVALDAAGEARRALSEC
jgi:hypothetical protein